ncbi:MAG: DUF3144 domain-containing protein [Gammaproteobacteria bacterium]
MSEEDRDREFRQMVDGFIDQANRYIETNPKENVGMALLYAASRFNAFVVASHAPSADKYDGDRKKAVEFFSSEYLRMLDENLDDYRQIYETDGETSR